MSVSMSASWNASYIARAIVITSAKEVQVEQSVRCVCAPVCLSVWTTTPPGEQFEAPDIIFSAGPPKPEQFCLSISAFNFERNWAHSMGP